AASRNRGPRASNRFFGSRSRSATDPCEACRYVAEVTISRCCALMFQAPLNSVASQSSSSGWLGGDPCTPKSSAVSTSPAPKNTRDDRLTARGAVRGGDGRTSQRASPSRVRGESPDDNDRTVGTPTSTASPG